MAADQGQVGPVRKLLALDGGGVRGVSSLLILNAIMEEVQALEDGHPVDTDRTKPGVVVTTTETLVNERRPIDYFDLVGGTSTGGLAAALLNRLGMTCHEAIGVYNGLSKEIFAVRLFGYNISDSRFLKFLGPVILKIRILFGTQFSAKYMNEAIDKILNQYVPATDPRDPDGQPYLVASRFNPYDAKGKMFMCATMADRGKAILFRNYTPPPDAVPETGSPDDRGQDQPSPIRGYTDAAQEEQQQQQPILDNSNRPTNNSDQLVGTFDYSTVTIQTAARATSAAPTYLPPEVIQNIQFWDGGLLNNNPIDEVWAARYDLTATCHEEPHVSTVLSLGTMWTDPPKHQPTGLLGRLVGILFKSLSFATNTEAKHMDFRRNIHRRNLRHPDAQCTSYFRFNAPLGKDAVDLADYGKIPFLTAKTEEFLALPETRLKIRKCARLLAKRIK